jgi:cardiolipin synthase
MAAETVAKYPKKVWFLIVFALATIFLILATLFTNFTESHTDLSSTVPLPLGSPDFVTAVEAVTHGIRQPVEGEITVFNDGSLFLTDLLGEIRSAQGSITITNYIFRDGTMTGAIFDEMTAKARAGVEVRVLLDWKGSSKAPEDKLEALEEAGGKVETFRPLGFRYLTRIHRRTHIRAIVVDGRVGYTGGLAFDDEWLGTGVGENQWRDLMFKYGGALARATQDHFNALWRQTNGEILSGPDFYPSTLAHGPHGGAGGSPDTTRAADSAVVAGRGADSAVAAGAAASGFGRFFVGLFHDPQPDLATDLQDLIWLSIVGASERVTIATPYMTPDIDVREAIMDAARRGVRVEVIMPGPYTDAKLIQAATRAYYDELLESGVRIFEYQPGRFHEKTVTVDGHWSIIGSANMDNRSATLNVENVFAVEDPVLAAALEAEAELSKESTVEITRAEWHPNLFQRAYFNLARLFAKQY